MLMSKDVLKMKISNVILNTPEKLRLGDSRKLPSFSNIQAIRKSNSTLPPYESAA